MSAIDDTVAGARPGSFQARNSGCTCPVLDNNHGAGRGGDGARWGWWVADNCPLHAMGRAGAERKGAA